MRKLAFFIDGFNLLSRQSKFPHTSFALRSGNKTSGAFTNYNQDKVDETVLALLYLTSFKEGPGTRAWKGMDWDTMNRLHEKGLISNPKSRAKSVILTQEGIKLSEELFKKYFGLA